MSSAPPCACMIAHDKLPSRLADITARLDIPVADGGEPMLDGCVALFGSGGRKVAA